MQLDSSQIAQYHDEGYTLVRGLIPQEVCATVRQRTQAIIEKDPGWPARHFQTVDPKRFTRPDGSFLPAGIQNPSRVDKVFESMACHPNLISAMGQLLKGEVELYTDQTLVKLGRITEPTARTYYHQDSYYWKIAPELGCNCWIAMDEVGHDAICLGILPGSHKGWELIPHESYYDEPSWCNSEGRPFPRFRIPLNQVDASGEVVLPMKPGDGLFFTNYTWHRSEPNFTGKDLAAYAIAYKRKGQK